MPYCTRCRYSRRIGPKVLPNLTYAPYWIYVRCIYLLQYYCTILNTSENMSYGINHFSIKLLVTLKTKRLRVTKIITVCKYEDVNVALSPPMTVYVTTLIGTSITAAYIFIPAVICKSMVFDSSSV